MVSLLSDMAICSHPSNQNSSRTALKFCLKFNPNHLSIPKRSNISIPSSIVNGGDDGSIVAGEINAIEPKKPACKEESLLVVDYPPTQASVDEPAVMNTTHVPEAAVANKNQKKRLFSVTLPRRDFRGCCSN
ncbi:hypothetical protein V6N12_024444 [Hibiscus sabdariffa]|uniref:Uncharacterized protein n=1 Tax=Hibiscus sabdariffa TaxID=183260 RepID=A0ABR2G0N8_9ROSI